MTQLWKWWKQTLYLKWRNAHQRRFKRKRRDPDHGKRRRTAGEKDHTTALALILALAGGALDPGHFSTQCFLLSELFLLFCFQSSGKFFWCGRCPLYNPTLDPTPLVEDRAPEGECLLVEEALPDEALPVPDTDPDVPLCAGKRLQRIVTKKVWLKYDRNYLCIFFCWLSTY